MNLHVAVDFGTSSTCVAMSDVDAPGREPQVVVIDGQPLMPSAVYVAADGTLFVGHEAERQAAVDPSRYEPHPKRRIDEGELLLGNVVLPVVDVVRAVLARAVGEARRLADGARVDLLVLTHPADWGAIRTRVLRQAGSPLAMELVLVPEPVAAAVFHSASHVLADGDALAVLDLGGGTVDASVVRRQSAQATRAGQFQVLAAKGDPSFGGADVDQFLLEHVGGLVAGTDPGAWERLVQGRELADRRRRRVLHQDVRGAKETLSRHSFTDVPMPPPFPDAHVTRAALERLIHAPLARAAELVPATLAAAGLTPQQLAAVFLVGGSSRIPLVARLVHESIGIVPVTLDQPETVVARGALRAVAVDPYRTGRMPELPTPAPGQVSGQQPPRPPGYGPPPGYPRPEHRPPVPGPPPRRSRTPWLVGGGVVLAAAVAAGLVFAVDWSPAGPQQSESSTDPSASPTGGSEPAGGRAIEQYDYRFGLPDGWVQSGGEPTARKVQLRPAGQQAGNEIIAVEERRLTFDSTVEHERAVGELRDEYRRNEANGLTGFDPDRKFAGKDVVYYQRALGDATVDWYSVFKGRVQVTVGCQYGKTGKEQVRVACERVVGSLTVSS